MAITAVKLEVLVIAFYRGFVDGVEFHSPAVQDALKWAKDADLVELERGLANTYKTTLRGDVYIAHLLGTPLPERSNTWTIPARVVE